MGVAVLRQGRLLIASVPANATDHELGSLLEGLSERVGKDGVNGVVIDVSALDVLDSYATRLLETIGQVARLRGAETVIVGIQPEVAIAMVQLGVSLEAVRTALDLEHGIHLLEGAEARRSVSTGNAEGAGGPEAVGRSDGAGDRVGAAREPSSWGRSNDAGAGAGAAREPAEAMGPRARAGPSPAAAAPSGERSGATRDAADLALRRALRTDRVIMHIRWFGVLFALVQVLTYYRPHPPGALPAALTFVALLATGNAVIMLVIPRVTTLRGARALGLGALGLDVTVVMGLVFVYTFDPETAMFAVAYVLPLEGAVRAQLRGALGTMAVVTALYTVREAFGATVYGNDFLLTSVSFRMGIGFIIAAFAGALAASLVGEREEAERARAEVERQAAALATANRELQAANRVKDDFVAMTNHELRTPLTTILGYTKTLQRRWHSVPDDQRLEFVRRIEQQGYRLRRLVESLLTMSLGQAGELELALEPVDVRTEMLAAVEVSGADESVVSVRCEDGVRVWADPDGLRQILTNYLSNALRYGGPPIVVDARLRRPWAEITVIDAGEGVPESFVPRLFDRFTQASRGDTRTAEGVGLGLAIVAHLAEAQGGHAWYEPGQPHGSRFSVRLLAADPPSAADEGCGDDEPTVP